MKRAYLLSIATVVLVITVQAQHGDHRHEASELGRVNFPVSCTPKAQKQFNRAVAWLHSFEYEEAEKAFTEVATTDPRCGIATGALG